MATKKTTVKKPLKKAQTGGYTSPYGGTGANKPKSNKSAMIAGVIGSAVSAAAAAIAKRKKSPQALVDQYMQKADKAKAKGKEERYKRFAKKAARKSNMIDQTNANVERKFSEENLTDQKKYGGAKKKLRKAQYGERVLEGPLPEYAAKEINAWNEQYPSPSGRGFNPSGPYSIKDPRASESGLNRLRNPNYSLHHQATNEFYNQNANLLKKDKKAFNEKMKTTKPGVISEIEKRKKITESTPARLATKPATPIQKKGGSTKTKMAKGGAVAKAKEGGDKKWIQKAINPKHKGYCTPMTKKTCTPKRKALAITLKKMAKNR